MSERAVRNAVLRKLKKEGWYVMPLSDKWASGYPDLLCIKYFDGILARHVFLELKSPTGKLSKIQVVTIAKLRSLGCEAYVVNDVKQLEDIL